MANIKPYTDQISSARYGEEVRGSIVNALTAMNDQISDDTASAATYATNAASSAQQAQNTSDALVSTLAQIETDIADFDTAEGLRATAEQNRVNAENARATAELARENEETGYVAQARAYAEQAAQHASSDNARLSESWAIGGTGVRYGEDISNSKYFSDQSQLWATGGTSGTVSATNNAKYWSDQSEARANERGTYWNDQLAITGQSWTEGGTGTRQGEDTNNAKYWSEQAFHWYEEAGEVVTEGGVTKFNGRNGDVVPVSGDYTASMIPRGTGSVESSLTTIESTVSAQDTRLTTAEADIDALETRMTTAESGITNLTNNKVDMTTPLLNFDDTAVDPTTDDGALANALSNLGILSTVALNGVLYIKKTLTELSKAVTGLKTTVASHTTKLRNFEVIADDYFGSGTTGQTHDYTLKTAAQYLVAVARVNSSTIGALYYVNSHATASAIATIVSSSVISATISNLNLSITCNSNYTRVTIIKLGG